MAGTLKAFPDVTLLGQQMCRPHREGSVGRVGQLHAEGLSRQLQDGERLQAMLDDARHRLSEVPLLSSPLLPAAWYGLIS